MKQTKKSSLKSKKNLATTKVKKDWLLELMESPNQLMVLLLIFLVTFGAVGYMQQKNGLLSGVQSDSLVFTDRAPYNTSKHLKSDYQGSLSNLINGYFQERTTAQWDDLDEPIDYSQKRTWLEKIQQTKNAVMNLTVPAEFKELHLNLVLALDWEEQAAIDLVEISGKLVSDQDKASLMKVAQEKLRKSGDYYEQILAEYSWL